MRHAIPIFYLKTLQEFAITKSHACLSLRIRQHNFIQPKRETDIQYAIQYTEFVQTIKSYMQKINFRRRCRVVDGWKEVERLEQKLFLSMPTYLMN